MMRPDTSQADAVNYKKKYQALKKKLRLLVYEQECFVDELKKSQRKLLKVSRDRSFLLDRLIQYEHLDDSSTDSDSTASSDSGNELVKDGCLKKKRPIGGHFPASTSGTSGVVSGISTLPAVSEQGLGLLGRLPKEPSKKKPKVAARKVPPKGGMSKMSPSLSMPGRSVGGAINLASMLEQPITNQPPRVVLSREEIERHLDLKHSSKPQFLSIDMTPHSLPDDIFSHDNSNQDCAEPMTENIKIEVDDSDLVIDMA